MSIKAQTINGPESQPTALTGTLYYSCVQDYQFLHYCD